MVNHRLECIDAGSEYCPCYLAETDDCIICSHLQGKEFCDCNWNGVCVYQDFYWLNEKKKDIRKTIEAQIVDKKIIGSDILILKIKVTKTLARQLMQPGSYIFIRDPNQPFFFDVPMSIMRVDRQKTEIDVAIQLLGAKTKKLLDCGEKVLLKGPYWNGLLGLKHLKRLKEKNILVIARGIALAPALLVIEYLLSHKNKVTFMMDPGKMGKIFIEDYLHDLDIEVLRVNLRAEEGLAMVKNLLVYGAYSVVYSGGSDKVHSRIWNQIKDSGKDVQFVITNNGKLCCGEGVCGSCSLKLKDGSTIKMCKTQLEAETLIGGRYE